MRYIVCAVAALAAFAQIPSAASAQAQPTPPAQPAPRPAGNPFVPQARTPTPAAPTPGAAVPGTPGTPLAPGAPTGVAPYGPPGAPGMPGSEAIAPPPLGPVEQAFADGARFVGCINGRHYFRAKTGGQVTFSAPVLRKAIRERIVPACR